jgi:putative hemolysin
MSILQHDLALRDNPIHLRRAQNPASAIKSGGDSYVLETAGPFEIRLAATAKELRSAQKLRYAIFYEEGGAIASQTAARSRRDICPFDAICDHLIVTDTEAVSASGRPKAKVVGTYRLLRRDVADMHHGFYSQGEFDMRDLLARQPGTRFLELGRSCVHANYRSKRVIELLWRGLWLYAKQHNIDALIGCASLPGTDLDALRLPLSFLHHYAQAGEEWQVAPWPQGETDFVPLPRDQTDVRRGLASLPPLLKAYLRTGARFSRSAVVDRQFGTTDVFTVMPMNDIEERYRSHFGEPSCVSGAPVA